MPGRPDFYNLPLQRRRGLRDRDASPGRLVGLALPLEEVRAKDQGDQVEGVQAERALNRAFFSGLVLKLLAGQREMDPALRVRAIGFDEALEHRPGGLKVSLAKGALAERGEGPLMVRVYFKNSPPKRVCFCVPARLGRAKSCGFEGRDLRQAVRVVLHQPNLFTSIGKP